MAYKLSICIPTLNRADYISQTLDSIVGQIETDVEIVIVDGGSSDDTEKIVKQYQKSCLSLRYIRSSSTANKPSNEGFDRDCDYAVERASGDYCWLMTDDDLLRAGAIKKILLELQKSYALIIANTEICNNDFSKQLVAKRPNIPSDQVYTANLWNQFASDVASNLTFVGAVIIKRSLWLSKNREKYFGSGFIHVGVIFDKPIIEDILVTSDPLVSIRFGNGFWSNRAFQIWMINWPELIWSFTSLSGNAKQAICHKEPWKNYKVLLAKRAFGEYSVVEYQQFIAPKLKSKLARLIPKLIAKLPRSVVYIPAQIYARITLSDNAVALFSLKESWKK